MTEFHTPSRPSRTPRWLLEAARHGDHCAQREILRRYEPLVYRVVWRLRLPLGCEREDIAQEARVGLVAAIRSWRPERGPFPAFADRCVTNQALMALEAACRHKHQLLTRAIPLDKELVHIGNGQPGADDPKIPLLECLEAPRDVRSDPEARLVWREKLATIVRSTSVLTARERTALAATINGLSYERLVLILGGTPKAASNVVYRARRKLARALPRAA